MDLPAFIDEVGMSEAAKQLKASYSAVAMWRRRDRIPRPKKAVDIERRTKGRVTVAEIYATPAPK
jgi:DNA-binding transcriptional regulator YdaS (Cro superfamily)